MLFYRGVLANIRLRPTYPSTFDYVSVESDTLWHDVHDTRVLYYCKRQAGRGWGLGCVGCGCVSTCQRVNVSTCQLTVLSLKV